MADNTEKMQQEFDKATSIMEAWRATMKASIKTTTEERLAEEKLILQLIKESGYRAEQATLAVQNIKREKEQQKLDQNALEREKERQALQEKIDQEKVAGAKQVAKSLGDFAVGSVKAANSVYSADNAFSAVTPIVTLMGTSLAGAIEGIAKMTTGFSIAGFSFGGMAEGAAKLAGVAISLTTQAMNMALENAGKLVENYNQLSKVGVTFGGDIEAMRESAANGGLALDTYTKFVTKNIESLSTFGGSTQRAADTVMKLTRATSDNNEKLLVMYGGFEALNEAAVGYVDLIAKTGFDVTRNVNSLNAGAASYLVNMKELSALTGQSAEGIKKEQEARMKSASYQMALSSMSAEEATAARNKVSLVTSKYGKEAGDLLEEMIAGNGTVISESGLQLQAMLGPIAQSIQDIYKVGYGPDAVERTATTMSGYADTIDAFTKQNKDLMFLNYGTQDQVLQMMQSVISQTRKTLNSQRDLSVAQSDLDAQNKKPATESAKSLEGVIKSLNQLKMDIDDKTIKSFGNMAEVTKNLVGVITNLYNMLTPETMGDAMKKFTSAIKEATDALRGLGGKPTAESAPTAAPRMGTAPGAGGTVVGGAGGEGDAGAIMEAATGTARGGTKLTIKSSESTAGGPADPRIQEIAELIASTYPGTVATAFDDAWHRQNRPNSKHTKGMAADLRIPGLNSEIAAEINKLIAGKGKADIHSNAEGRGQHLHVEAAMAKGGITSGPSLAGEAGPEAVIPLPDGRTIPVRMDMSEMVNKLEEMVDLLRDQRDNSEKMLYAVQ